MPAACDNEVVVRNTFLHVIEHLDDERHYESDEESELSPGFAVPRSITAPSLGVSGDVEGTESSRNHGNNGRNNDDNETGFAGGLRCRSLSESLEKDRAAAVAAVVGRASRVNKARSEPTGSDADQKEEGEEDDDDEDEDQEAVADQESESQEGQTQEREYEEAPTIIDVDQDVSGIPHSDETPGQAVTKKMPSKKGVDSEAEVEAEVGEDSASEAGSDWWADVAKPRFDQQFMRHRTFDPFDGPHEGADIELPNLVRQHCGEMPMPRSDLETELEAGSSNGTGTGAGAGTGSSCLLDSGRLGLNLPLPLPFTPLPDAEERKKMMMKEEIVEEDNEEQEEEEATAEERDEDGEELIVMPVSTPSPTNFPLLRGSSNPFSLEDDRDTPMQEQPQGSSPQQPGFPSAYMVGGHGYCNASPLTPASPAPRSNCAMAPTPTTSTTASTPCTWCVTVPCPSPSYHSNTTAPTPTMSPIVTSTFTATSTSPFNVQMPQLGTQDGQRACERQPPMNTQSSMIHTNSMMSQVSPSSPDGLNNRPASFAFFTPFNSNNSNSNMNSSNGNSSPQQMCKSSSNNNNNSSNTMSIGNNGNNNNSNNNTNNTTGTAETHQGARDFKLERCLFEGCQSGALPPAALRAIPTPMRQTRGMNTNSNNNNNNNPSNNTNNNIGNSNIHGGNSPGNAQEPQQQQQPRQQPQQPPQLPNFSHHRQFQGASPSAVAATSMSMASMVTPTSNSNKHNNNNNNSTPTAAAATPSAAASTPTMTTPMGRRGSFVAAGSGSSSNTTGNNAQHWPAPVGEEEADGPCTTVMVKNLPNNYTRSMLLELIDACGFRGDYNFLYMPIDFRTRAAMGYAFVNMETKEAAQRLFQCLDGFSDWSLPSSKVCNVAWSDPRQGIDSHIARYRNSPLMHAVVPDEYRPALFANGRRVQFPPPTKRVKAPRQGTERMLV